MWLGWPGMTLGGYGVGMHVVFGFHVAGVWLACQRRVDRDEWRVTNLREISVSMLGVTFSGHTGSMVGCGWHAEGMKEACGCHVCGSEWGVVLLIKVCGWYVDVWVECGGPVNDTRQAVVGVWGHEEDT